jgi:type I restriction enzyme S subunit
MDHDLASQSGPHLRTYLRAHSVVFLRTRDEFGGLSNMAAGFSLRVNDIFVPTVEALYQACRFPHLPFVQRLVIDQGSPMAAKMKSKPYRASSRPDWDQVRVRVMRWCLHVKLAQNWSEFADLLHATGDRPIVEESRRDAFWGAKQADDQTLVGTNALGRLLMELREEVSAAPRESLLAVSPPAISEFLLDGRPIGVVTGSDVFADIRSIANEGSAMTRQSGRRPTPQSRGRQVIDQRTLSDWLLPTDDD